MKELFLNYLHKKFCCHDWEERYRANIYINTPYVVDKNKKVPDDIRVTLICKKCGKIKQIKL